MAQNNRKKGSGRKGGKPVNTPPSRNAGQDKYDNDPALPIVPEEVPVPEKESATDAATLRRDMDEVQETPPPKRKTHWWLILLGLLIIAAIILFFCLRGCGRDGKETADEAVVKTLSDSGTGTTSDARDSTAIVEADSASPVAESVGATSRGGSILDPAADSSSATAYSDSDALAAAEFDTVSNSAPMLKASKPVAKSATVGSKEIDELAHEVIMGEFGNGSERRKALGDKFGAVQHRVDQLLASHPTLAMHSTSHPSTCGCDALGGN